MTCESGQVRVVVGLSYEWEQIYEKVLVQRESQTNEINRKKKIISLCFYSAAKF